jgi:hypothetical protein
MFLGYASKRIFSNTCPWPTGPLYPLALLPIASAAYFTAVSDLSSEVCFATNIRLENSYSGRFPGNPQAAKIAVSRLLT